MNFDFMGVFTKMIQAIVLCELVTGADGANAPPIIVKDVRLQISKKRNLLLMVTLIIGDWRWLGRTTQSRPTTPEVNENDPEEVVDRSEPSAPPLKVEASVDTDFPLTFTLNEEAQPEMTSTDLDALEKNLKLAEANARAQEARADGWKSEADVAAVAAAAAASVDSRGVDYSDHTSEVL